MPLPSHLNASNNQLLLQQKINKLKVGLASLNVVLPKGDIAVYTSPNTHFRLRAEFKVWHEGSNTYFAMSDPETKEPIYIDDFPIASIKINSLMPPLLNAINTNEVLRKKCFQIEFLSSLAEDTIVTLIYHKPLDDEWISAAKSLQDSLDIAIIGRSRKQKIVLDRDYVIESLTVNNTVYRYKQIEGGFTQPNGIVCQHMLSWAVNNSRHLRGDLLELYCGNGNFTLPLSLNFTKVLATEIAKTSVNAAQWNLTENAIDNVDIVRMSSEDFVQAMDKVRKFRRLKEIDLDDYNFSTVFVDPPRAGLDTETLEMLKRFNNIIYISCNPTTLIDNLKSLCETHTIESLAVFDQFPHTQHLESGVILSKKI